VKVSKDNFKRLRKRVEGQLEGNYPWFIPSKIPAYDLSHLLTSTFLAFLDEPGTIAGEEGTGGILIPAPTEDTDADRDD
jgi:hypothetical protein